MDKPCQACSWTDERQEGCRYRSHVKLFYGVSDRGVWSLGSRFVVKERSTSSPTVEARNIRFLQENTTIPVPRVVEEWEDDDGRYFMINERIQGETLEAAWLTLSLADKERIAKQTAEYLSQLRNLQSPQMQSLDGRPLYDSFFFPTTNHPGTPYGPLSSDDELWKEMTGSLGAVPEKALQRLRERMPPASPWTFTHGDLTDVNIIVKDGNLAAIIDWERSGYYPVWWECACAVGFSQEDYEWKCLLLKHMPDYPAARKLFRDLRALRNYPTLDEAGEQLMKELLKD